MEMIMLENDLGGVCFVGKNELRISFRDGTEYTILLNTRKLFFLALAEYPNEWKEKKFTVAPYCRDENEEPMIIISVRCKCKDCDKAVIVRDDLLQALLSIELLCLVRPNAPL